MSYKAMRKLIDGFFSKSKKIMEIIYINLCFSYFKDLITEMHHLIIRYRNIQ